MRTIRFCGMMLIWLGWGFAASGQVALARQDETTSEIIIEADSGEETTVDGVARWMLLDALLRQDDTVVYADRLIEEAEGSDQYLLSGNVRITERGDTVTADVVHYDGKTKVGRASGHVVLTDGSSTLISISAVYYSEEKRAEFDDGVEYADSLTLLTSERGEYWSDDAVADFFGNVRLRQEDLYLEADSINYRRNADIMQAGGNVVIDRFEGEIDSTRVDRAAWFGYDGMLQGFNENLSRTLLFSQSVYYDGGVDSSWVDGKVFLLRTDEREESTDSLLVSAESMILMQSGGFDRVIAVDSVVVVERNFSVTGDSLVYDRVTQADSESVESRMFGRPRTWLNDSQITSDSLRIFGTGGAIDSLHARGNLFVASRDTSLERIQQLKGRNMVAYFEDDSLRTMTVSPNAEALYYIEPEPGEPIVAVQVSADRIDFAFEDGTVSNIHVITQIEGTLFPNKLINQATDLEEYQWEPNLKPGREGMLRELLIRENSRAARIPSGISTRRAAEIGEGPGPVTGRGETTETDPDSNE